MNKPVTTPQGPLTWSLRDDGVAVICYDIVDESVNTLRADFVDAFNTTLDEIDSDPDTRAAVLVSGKKDSFIVGADVRMFDSLGSHDDIMATIERGHRALAQLRRSHKPVVAAIHGPALGGGLEVALACQGRVCSDSSKTSDAEDAPLPGR